MFLFFINLDNPVVVSRGDGSVELTHPIRRQWDDSSIENICRAVSQFQNMAFYLLLNFNAMDTNRYIDQARKYVLLSNGHDLELIMQMFASDTTYYSSFFGEFEDCLAIREMMVNFFSRFSDAYWDVQSYRLIGDRSVDFVFVMTGTDATSGEHVERHGIEKIHFAPDGLISRIEVLGLDEK